MLFARALQACARLLQVRNSEAAGFARYLASLKLGREIQGWQGLSPLDAAGDTTTAALQLTTRLRGSRLSWAGAPRAFEIRWVLAGDSRPKSLLIVAQQPCFNFNTGTHLFVGYFIREPRTKKRSKGCPLGYQALHEAARCDSSAKTPKKNPKP